MENKRRPMDKKAWIKIMEAFMAIVIIVGVIMVLLFNSPIKKGIGDSVYDKQKFILDHISNTDSLRIMVINENEAGIRTEINKLIPGSWEYDIKICSLDDICNLDTIPKNKDIYVAERVISSTLSNSPGYSPKKLRFFVWAK